VTEFGSNVYQRSEKPCQSVRERELLNENWIAISTGTIDQAMYIHVKTTRNRGLPHGLLIQPRILAQPVSERGGVGRAAASSLTVPAPSMPGGSRACSSPSAPPGRRTG